MPTCGGAPRAPHPAPRSGVFRSGAIAVRDRIVSVWAAARCGILAAMGSWTVIYALVFASAIWVLVDAIRIGYDKADIEDKGVMANGPVVWFFGTLLFWIVGFPLYLLARPTLKRAAAMRRFIADGGLRPEALVPGVTDPHARLTPEQAALGLARLAALRDQGTITDKVCRQYQAMLIARRQ